MSLWGDTSICRQTENRVKGEAIHIHIHYPGLHILWQKQGASRGTRVKARTLVTPLARAVVAFRFSRRRRMGRGGDKKASRRFYSIGMRIRRLHYTTTLSQSESVGHGHPFHTNYSLLFCKLLNTNYKLQFLLILRLLLEILYKYIIFNTFFIHFHFLCNLQQLAMQLK